MSAPQYSKFIVGDYKFSMQIVCDDGQIRMVAVEEYADGFMAILTKDGTPISNRVRYETSRKAVNAAAKW